MSWKIESQLHEQDLHRYRVAIATSDEGGVTAIFTFDQLYDKEGAIWCEIYVEIETDTLDRPIRAVPLTRCNLLNATRASYGAVIDQLNTDYQGIEWKPIVQELVSLSAFHYRAGAPSTRLTGKIVATDVHPFLLRPLIAGNGVTVLYAEGGLGKSKVALAAGLSVATGLDLLGVVPNQTGPVVYFDYEDNDEPHQQRLAALVAGYHLDLTDVEFYHQRLVSSAVYSQTEMRRKVNELGAVLAIVDSIGLARGGNANAPEDTIRLFRALRSLRVPVLALDHIAAEDVKAKAKDSTASVPKPYGSVYTTNSARMTWAMRQVTGATGKGRRQYEFVNTKANHVAPQRSFVLDEIATEHRDNQYIYGALRYDREPDDWEQGKLI